MDEKSIKILETILLFGPISGPDILVHLEENGLKMNVKTVHQIILKWNYLFAHIGDGRMKIIFQKKNGYFLNHDYLTSAQQRFFMDAISSSSLLDDQEKEHLALLCRPFGSMGKYDQKEQTYGFLSKMSVVQAAISEKKTLRFSYLDYLVEAKGKDYVISKKYRNHGNDKKDKSNETYLVSPYEIMVDKGMYYLLSYCDKHPENLTIFRIDRMDKIRLARSNYFYHLKDIVDYDKKKEQLVNMFVGQKEYQHIRIKFDQEIFKTIIDQFGINIRLGRDIDGKPILELDNFAVSQGLISWIMMMGDKVEVLSPISLRQEILNRLKQLLRKYQTGRKIESMVE